MSPTRTYDRLRKLTPGCRGDALVAATVLPLVWLALRLPGFLVRRALSPVAMQTEAADLEQARRLGDIVNATASRVLGPNQCLARSLVLLWMLRRRGIASQLRIGVRRADSVLFAHAWVECNHTPVNDRESIALQYAVFGEPVRPLDFEG